VIKPEIPTFPHLAGFSRIFSGFSRFNVMIGIYIFQLFTALAITLDRREQTDSNNECTNGLISWMHSMDL